MIDRLYVRCIEALIIFGVIVMVTLTFASTVLRFVPGVGGIYWAEELTRYSNVWVVFLAGGLGVRYGIHLGVDVVAARVPIPVRKILTVVSCLLMIAFEIVLIYFGTIVTISNMQQQSASLEVPMGASSTRQYPWAACCCCWKLSCRLSEPFAVMLNGDRAPKSSPSN